MASYEAPTSIFPIFDSLVFQAPNSGSLTIAEGDARYLGRTNVATSIATATQFSGDVSVGNTLLQQSTTTLNIDNQASSSVINLKTKTAGGAAVTPLSLSSTAVTVNLPMTLGYTVAPVAGQIGYTQILTGNGTNVNPMISGTYYNTRTLGFPSLPIGTYILKVMVSFACNTAGKIDSFDIGLSSTTPSYTDVGAVFENISFGTSVVSGQRVIGSSTYVFFNNSVRTLYGIYTINFSTGAYATNTSTCNLQYTRIA
jgi:hypothetical protein